MLNIVHFVWMSYSAPGIVAVIPPWVHEHAHMWCINAPMLNFSTVDWYNADRVLWQFGCIKDVQQCPQDKQEEKRRKELGSGTSRINCIVKSLDGEVVSVAFMFFFYALSPLPMFVLGEWVALFIWWAVDGSPKIHAPTREGTNRIESTIASPRSTVSCYPNCRGAQAPTFEVTFTIVRCFLPSGVVGW